VRQTGTPSSAASTPRTRNETSCRAPAWSPRCAFPGARRAGRLGDVRGVRDPHLLRPIISKLWRGGRTGRGIGRMKRASRIRGHRGENHHPFHIRVMNNRHFIEGTSTRTSSTRCSSRRKRRASSKRGGRLATARSRCSRKSERAVAQRPGGGRPVSMWKYSTRPGIRKIG